MKTKKILAGALAAAVVTTSLPGMGVPVFAQTEYGTTLFENRYTDTKPFAFPTEENATATLEAELATSLNNDDTGDRPDQVLPQLSVIIVISHVPQLCFKQLPATSSIHCTFYHF